MFPNTKKPAGWNRGSAAEFSGFCEGYKKAQSDLTKPWWKSRTIWLQIIVAVLGAIELQWNLVFDGEHSRVLGVVAIVSATLNSVLRIVTVERLSSGRDDY